LTIFYHLETKWILLGGVIRFATLETQEGRNFRKKCFLGLSSGATRKLVLLHMQPRLRRSCAKAALKGKVMEKPGLQGLQQKKMTQNEARESGQRVRTALRVKCYRCLWPPREIPGRH
jgi:hypothetical protein